MRSEAIGIDVGGTKVEAILLKNEKVVKRLKEPTKKTQKQLFSQLRILANKLSKTAPIGISFPGFLNEGVLHECPNLPFLEGKPILQLLRRELHRTIAFENDANCFIIAEHELGHRKAKNAVGLIIGTGIGAGIILEGKIYKGSRNGAGELGYITYKDGQSIEEYAAGPGILKRFYAHGGKKEDAQKLFTARSGAAKQTVKETIEAIQWLCDLIQHTFDPDVIILGGGVSNAPIVKKLKGNIKQNTLGAEAGVIGAALLALKESNNKV